MPPLLFSQQARIYPAMPAAKSSAAKPKRSVTKRPLTYRGVPIQRPPGQSRFTRKQIEQAVSAALAKYVDDLAGRGRS